MTISQRFKQDLRDRITLSEVIGRRVKLTRAGREFKGCCPFHHEKTPSFTVNDDKQFYHCFGCGAHGDVIGFVMQHDNLSFIDAMEVLAADAGMQVPKPSPEQVQQAKREKGIQTLVEDATVFFEQQLQAPSHAQALDYMRGRDIPEEIMQAFRIGYAPSDGQAVRIYLKQQGYTDSEMIEAGVLRASSRGGQPYSFFRERVMFPVADRRGRVVAFGGRILPDHLRAPDRGDFKPPKYINSSDTPLFHKGRMLYGESQARQAAADGAPVLVVEGYLDVMACFQAGFKGAVAPLGTALTEEQIMLLWQMIPGERKAPILCFDGDEAGRRAAARACERFLPLLKPGHYFKVVFLPSGHDPDSLVREGGRKALEKIVQTAILPMDFMWSMHTEGQAFEAPEEWAALKKSLEEEVSLIPDRDIQFHYLKEIRNRIYESSQKGRGRAKGRAKNPGAVQMRSLKISKPAQDATMLHQKILLATILNHPHIFEQVEEDIGRLHIAHKRLDSLRQEILSALLSQTTLDTEALHSHLKGLGYEEELLSLLSNAVYIHARFAMPGVAEDKVLSGWQDILNCGVRLSDNRNNRSQGIFG